MLDFPAAHLRAYPIYTVAAEKLEASVRLGEQNTRMKDFFDLWFLSRNFSFDGELLKDALVRTFARREMSLPLVSPVALTPEFATMKAVTWAAFMRRNGLGSLEMTTVLEVIHEFVWPAMEAAARDQPFLQGWSFPRGWSPRQK